MQYIKVNAKVFVQDNDNKIVTVDDIEMASALLNKYVEHLAQGKKPFLGNQNFE